MKVTRISIRNYRGIETFEAAIAPGGAVFAGGNKRGKTTCINAIKACLTAQEIDSDAVRLGSDKADLLIDLDNHTVKRAISRNSPSKLTVERDGMKASKPTTYLAELLGTSTLDPLDFYLADAKKRKAQILAALPITVTIEQLRKYAPDIDEKFDVSGHGLEVVERARKFYYDERTLANKEAAAAKATAERLAEEAATLAKAVSPGPLVPIDRAKEAVAAAERAQIALESRVAEAVSAGERTASQRDEIARLRAAADAQAERFAGAPIDLEPLLGEEGTAEDLVNRLTAQLRDAEAALEVAKAKTEEARRSNRILDAAREEISSKRAQADAIEAALASATAAPPTDAAMAKAASDLEVARATLERAETQAKAVAAVEAAEAAKKEHAGAEVEALDLDDIVKRLAKDAPTELLASAEGIPGLTVVGDAIFLDGKPLDSLSGAEQLALAVEIARRANAKSKILVVDGLERLDEDEMERFVELATRDDWQLLASRVTKGELVIEALEPGTRAAAAE